MRPFFRMQSHVPLKMRIGLKGLVALATLEGPLLAVGTDVFFKMIFPGKAL